MELQLQKTCNYAFQKRSTNKTPDSDNCHTAT